MIMPISLNAKIFDGESSTRNDVSLIIGEDGIISCEPALFPPTHIRDLKVSSRVGNIPRTLMFPDGMIVELDNSLDEFINEHHNGIDKAHRLESKSGIALGAMLFVFVFIFGSVFWGIPWASNALANVLPVQVSVQIGEGALESLDKVFFYETLLNDERQNELQNKFTNLLQENEEGLEYTLVFRQGGMIGANAFALPDGTIVMTDELVELALDDDEILSILLHEIGHIVHRHSLRQIISHSGLAVLTVMMTGDAVSAGTLMLSLPNVLLESSFSREHESEADEYSKQQMQRLNIKTYHFANIMQRLEEEYLELEEGEGELDYQAQWLEYFSSHPATAERIAAFRTENSAEFSYELTKPELLSNNQSNPEQLVFDLRALLELGDFGKLEGMLNYYQQGYESGEESELTLEILFEYLSFSEREYEALFEAWVNNSPDKYMPYLARATYYYTLADTIGSSYQTEETEEAVTAEVNDLRARAKSDANKALLLKPNAMLTYSILAAIANQDGDRVARQNYIDEALKASPASYVARRDALRYLAPDYGGSYAKMARFLVETKKHLRDHPELEPLMGYLSYVKSWDAYKNSKYKRTIRLTTHALKAGDDALVYKQRANAYYSLQAYEYALIDYTNAIALQPYYSDLYLWRAYTYIELEQDEMALKDLRYAARLFPHNRDILVQLGIEANYMKYFSEADRAFKQAQINNPDSPYLLYNTGRNLFFGENKAEEALPYLQKAVDINAGSAKYWYTYGAVLNSLGDCRAVTAFREQLALCKEDEAVDCDEETRDWGEQKLAELTEGECRL